MRSATAFLFLALLSTMARADMLVYFGSYARGEGAGIYVAAFDPERGTLGHPRRAAAMDEPGFVALHPDGRHLYAVGERATGVVRAFALSRETGMLSTLNDRSSGGPGPCHVSLDAAGTFLFAANYTDASVVALRIQSDGFLAERTARMAYHGSGPNPERQRQSYAHCAVLDPTQRFLLVGDLGSDRVMIHRFDPASGSLTPNDPPFLRLAPGSGPRHVMFHPDGRHAYVINELANTLAVCGWDADGGRLTVEQTVSTLPDGYSGQNTAAEVVVHPSGRYLYASNRGHDSIAIFAIEAASGRLEARGSEPSGGQTPRNFAVDPTGRWMIVANQDSNEAALFAVVADGVRLEPSGTHIPVPNPTCVRFFPPPKKGSNPTF